MAWLRMDDGFAIHPKILMLTRAERWTWMEVLCYCARYRTEGAIPFSISEAIPKANRAFLAKCADVGLLDVTDEPAYEIHDWILYNGDTIEAKVAAYLTKHPDATANEVQRAIGGKREIVLEVVRRYLEAVPEVVPGEPKGNRSGGSPSGTQVVHARAHPSLTPKELKNQPTTSTADGLVGIEIDTILKGVA